MITKITRRILASIFLCVSFLSFQVPAIQARPETGSEIAQAVTGPLRAVCALLINYTRRDNAQEDSRSKKALFSRVLAHFGRAANGILALYNQHDSYHYHIPWVTHDIGYAIYDIRNLVMKLKNKNSGQDSEINEKILEAAIRNKPRVNGALKALDSLSKSIMPLVEGSLSFAVAWDTDDSKFHKLDRAKLNGFCSLSRLITEVFDVYKSPKVRALFIALVVANMISLGWDLDQYKKEEKKEQERQRQEADRIRCEQAVERHRRRRDNLFRRNALFQNHAQQQGVRVERDPANQGQIRVIAGGQDPVDQCLVCMEPFNGICEGEIQRDGQRRNQVEIQDREALAILHCNHVLCAGCRIKMYERPWDQVSNRRCPACRADMDIWRERLIMVRDVH